MRLTRVYVEADLNPGAIVELARDTASHLAKVLRARSGDEVILFNGQGGEAGGVIDSVRGTRVAVAISACEQCGRNRLPQFEPAQPLLNFLGDLRPVTCGALRLVLEPEEDSAVFALRAPAEPLSGVEFAIGPEGGFAPEELEAFQLSGFTRTGLGPRVLRTETAAIAALVMLQTRFGDMAPLA